MIPKTRDFRIAPSMTSCIFAIIFYGIYVIRFKGIKRTVETYIDISFCVLLILLLSSIFELILTTDNLRFLGFIPLPSSYTVLIITIIASLLGVKLVSVGCVLFIAITAISNVTVASDAMGFLGVIYVMCSFMGMLLYITVEPAAKEIIPALKSSFVSTFGILRKDFSEAKNEIDTIVNSIPKQ